jgi:hypothetical protein
MKKVSLVMLICVCAFGVPLQAQIIESGFGGALSGAVLGSLVAGQEGAAWGAAIGGGYGLIQGANEHGRRMEAESAFRRQQQERAAWEREDLRRRQQEMASLAARQECCVPTTSVNPSHAAPSADSLVVLETKKSLIRMGYDPGLMDSQLNAETITAIRAYEAKYNLLVTGKPSQELLKHMLKHGG